MSLLMDALKKAEREKNKAAKKDREANDSTSEQEGLDATSEEKKSTEGAQTTKASGEDENNDTWAFDTGELELEPMPNKVALEPEKDSRIVDGDVTLAETLPPQGNLAADSSETPPQQENTQTIKSEFDHDATLPSERAIQSSLKDYFEASQSITMDQASISGPLSQNTSEHSFTNTSPLDSSATHVTAHTIFTASQTRQASTGLLKYAIFGTLFLALGLGAVALYYSAMTPTVIETAPVVTGVADPGTSSTVVDVKQTTPPFEPDANLALNAVDPVIESVVNAENIEQNDSSSFQESLVSGPPVDADEAASSVQVDSEAVSLANDKAGKKETSLAKDDPSAEKQLASNTDTTKTQKNDIVNSSSKDGLEASILQTEKRNQAGSNQAPLEVMAAKDFSEALTMPKSAIKITRGVGKSRGVRNSDIMNAYQAYQSGDYISAKAEYRKILNSRPDNRDARLGLAAIATQEGKRETASRHYQHLLQQNPKDEVVNAAIFSLYGNSFGNVNESQLKLMLDQSPSSPQLHFSLGSFYAKQSRWAEAQQSFFDAFAADKNNADYAYNLAVSLEQIGQSKSALGYYRQALKLADKSRVNFNTSKVLARIQKLSGLAAN